MSEKVEEVVFCPNCGWNSAMDGPGDGLAEKLKAGSIALRNDRPASSSIMEEAATALQSQAEQIERLTRERDEWEAKWIAADEGEKLNAEFLAYSDARSEAAEQQVQRLAAESERLRKGLRVVELRAANAAWNMGKPSHQFTRAEIQNGFCEIRDHARTVLEAQEGGK